MHSIQQKILELSKDQDLGKLSLRKMGEAIGEQCSPQKIKHHLEQLKQKGLLKMDKIKGTMEQVKSGLDKAGSFFSIPILGSANCGEAVAFAEGITEGYLKVSSRLLGIKRERSLFALKAIGHSMNQTSVGLEKKCIEDGDYVVVDPNIGNLRSGDIVVSIIDTCANIKKFIIDKENHQVVLMSESTLDFPPIYIHEEDGYMVNGKVVQVIKKPKGI